MTPGKWKAEVPSGTTIGELIQMIGADKKEIAVATINGKSVPFSHVVEEGIEVTLVSHMGGG